MRLLIFILCLIPSIAIGGQFDAVVQQYNAAGGATGLSKTSLVAWYDFGDATDAHASYDLTEVGTPSYTSGTPNYGTASDSVTGQWVSSATGGVLSAWATTNTNCTIVIRWRGYGTLASGDYVFRSSGFKTRLRYTTSSSEVMLNDVGYSTGHAATMNTWYLYIIEYDSTTSKTKAYINNSQYSESAAGTYSYANVDMVFGGAPSSPEDIEIDYIGFFNRKLTSDERTWLYNSGGTRTYADLN